MDVIIVYMGAGETTRVFGFKHVEAAYAGQDDVWKECGNEDEMLHRLSDEDNGPTSPGEDDRSIELIYVESV